MSMITGLLDRLALVASIGVAGATPSFIQQYRQQVNGRLEQAITDLQPFVQIANQRHGGELNSLIDHHLQSNDATFVREGQAIEDIVQSVQHLNEANQSLDGSLWSQAAYLAQNVDAGVANSTWSLFQPAFALTGQGLVFALTVGVGVWLVILGSSAIFGALWRALRRSPRISVR